MISLLLSILLTSLFPIVDLEIENKDLKKEYQSLIKQEKLLIQMQKDMLLIEKLEERREFWNK